MKYPSLNIGYSNFLEFRQENSFYVDKTDFIEELTTNLNKVSLITRPHRFGKTLTLSTIKEFFEIGKDSHDIFSGLKISKNKDICDAWMNKYPVISISLKSVNKRSFELVLSNFTEVINEILDEHGYLLESTKLTTTLRRQLASFTEIDSNKSYEYEGQLSNALKILTRAFSQHWSLPVILLIDEYDVPLSSSYEHSYYNKMTDFMRGLLGEGLKDNKYLRFAVLTGCLRITKESIFTGLNNFVSYGITNNIFSDKFVFTEN